MPVAERRIREKEGRKHQILDSARELFFEKGFEQTTVEEIAEKTELSKGTIYLYFPSKEDIYIHIMLEGSALLYEFLKDSIQGDLPADTLLRRMGHAYYQFYKEYTGYFRMLFLYYSTLEIHEKVGAELRSRCESQAMKSLELVAGVIAKGVAAGLFKQCDPLDYAVLCWTCQNGIILLGERGHDQLIGLNVEKLHDLYLESMIISLKAGR